MHACVGVGVGVGVSRTLVAIMCNCCNLLSVNHAGIRALVPEFTATLSRLMECVCAVVTVGWAMHLLTTRPCVLACAFALGACSAARKAQSGLYGGLPLSLLNNACVIMLSSMLCLPNNFSNPDSAGLFFTSKTAHTVTRAEAAVKAEPSAKADKGPLAMLGSSLRGEVNKVRDLGSPVCLANVSHLTTSATYWLLCSCWCQRCPCNRTSAPCR